MIPLVAHLLKPGDIIIHLCPLIREPFDKIWTGLIIGQGNDLWIKWTCAHGGPPGIDAIADWRILVGPRVNH